MDRISHLHDELLLRILSLLPTKKDVMSTMVLSKRWRFLWRMVPRLVYDDSVYDDDEGRRMFSRFVDKSLFLHEAPVIETLHFKLGEFRDTGDIESWIRGADKCSVGKLIIEIDTCSDEETPFTLPRNLYTCCKMLVTLKLNDAVFLDVDSPISFPNLKKLSLVSMKYPGDEFVNKLLSGSPNLEDLEVKQCRDDNLTIFSVRMLHLKSLVLHTYENKTKDNAHGFVIDTPSLEVLDILDHKHGFFIIENDLPRIKEAKLDSTRSHAELLLRSITSTKRLDLCLSTSKDAYPVGITFHHLVHFKICTCQTGWLDLLMRLLIDSPNLKSLKLEQCHEFLPDQPRPCWSEPSSAPECLLSSLETVEWLEYEGGEEEKELVAFILRSSNCLKRVTIKANTRRNVKKLRMIQELSLSPRRSPTCVLSLD